MAKKRCIQCDKPLPESWASTPNQKLDPVCPECALRNLRKKSIRRRRILDTSVRKKPVLKKDSTTALRPSRKQSTRADIPLDIELDTDDPVLLSAHGKADEGQVQLDRGESEEKKGKAKPDGETDEFEVILPDEKSEDTEQTTQLKKRKPPTSPGPQIKLNF